MAIVRGDFDQPFVPIWNATARDRRLSFRARGILTFVLSLPPGARVTTDELAEQSDKEGRDAIRTAVTELEEKGYVRRVKQQDDQGRWSTDVHVYGSPQEAAEGEPTPGKPTPGNPSPVSPAETSECAGRTDDWKTVGRFARRSKKTGVENEEDGGAVGPSDLFGAPAPRSARRAGKGRHDTAFTAFWERYPGERKAEVSTEVARKAFNDACTRHARSADVLEGLDRWVASWDARGTEPQFIPSPLTWLKEKRWEASPPMPPPEPKRVVPPRYERPEDHPDYIAPEEVGSFEHLREAVIAATGGRYGNRKGPNPYLSKERIS